MATDDPSRRSRERQMASNLLFGTAFKFDDTADLVKHALSLGYLGFDTAAVTRAYNEKLAGEALRSVVKSGALSRDKICVQTKFSPYIPGKDAAFFPYDITTSIEEQVAASISGSLKNFHVSDSALTGESTAHLDVVILHAPYPSLDDTLAAYRALEGYFPDKIKELGVSNIDIRTLRAIWEHARIKPILVQNRFTADIESKPNPEMPPGIDTPEDRYDAEVRKFCAHKGITYQPWGLLWGSANLLESRVIQNIAKTLDVDKEVALQSCMQDISTKVTLLVGTSKKDRITSTVEGLTRIDVWKVDAANQGTWTAWIKEFRELLKPQA